MNAIRTAVTAASVTVLVALAGCGGNTVAGTAAPVPEPPQPPASTAAPDPAADQKAAEQAFRDYYAALLARDFTAACGLNAPETTQQMLATLLQRGITATTCEEGFAAVYALPGEAEKADQRVRSAKVESVTVAGDTASVHWSAEVNGSRTTVTSQLRRGDGKWRLIYSQR